MDLISPFLQAAFNFALTAVITGVQIVVWPVNTLIDAALPSLAATITSVGTSLDANLAWINWALSFFPPGLETTFLFILGVELIMLPVWQASYYVDKLWWIVGVIKFW